MPASIRYRGAQVIIDCWSMSPADRSAPRKRSVIMRKLIASTFVSLDGIMQSPGRPDEDPTGDFTLGGWMSGYADKSMDVSAWGFDAKDRELVLGRRTYEIFEAYWPYQSSDNPVAKRLNETRKYARGQHFTGTTRFCSTAMWLPPSGRSSPRPGPTCR